MLVVRDSNYNPITTLGTTVPTIPADFVCPDDNGFFPIDPSNSQSLNPYYFKYFKSELFKNKNRQMSTGILRLRRQSTFFL